MVSSINSIMQNLQILNKENAKVTHSLSSGEALEYGSDDSSTYTMILSLQSSLRTYGSIQTQIEDATLINTFADSSLASAKTTVESIKTKILKALNDTVNSDDKQILATEIEDMKKSLLSLANSSVNDKYLFGGTSYMTTPFVEDETTGQISYVGNYEEQQVNVDKNKYVTQGANGIDAFYYTTSTALSGENLEFGENELIVDSQGNQWKFIDSNNDGTIDTDKLYLNGDITQASIDVTDLGTTPATYSLTNTQSDTLEVKHSLFDDLDEMITTLRDTSLSEDEQDAILSESLEKITSAYSAMNIAHSIVGSRTNLIENYGDVIQSKITNLTALEQEYAGADLTQLALKSQALENTYTSLYYTINKVNSLSLINYLS
ncbi:MAG: flagellar hook-associated protein FlgL [Arcobacteraceae bacterium]